MHIVYYISSHGYGHGIRSCAIINSLSPTVTLSIKTLLPQEFFDQELSRPYNYILGNFDCGCVQMDSVQVDQLKTLSAYMKIADTNIKLLKQEIQWCRDTKISGIVSDIAAFPFEVAHHADIRSIAISNFSWFDIYQSYLKEYPSFKPYLHKLAKQYQMADLLLSLSPANAMENFEKKINIPLVGRRGTNRRKEIIHRFNLNSEKKLGLIYTGTYGMDTIPWKKLEKFEQWEFLGIYPIPGNPRNYTVFKKDDMSYQDFSASVDLLISKIGYGVFSECFINGLPLLYLSRKNFAEYPILEKAIQEWGHGYIIPYKDFYNLEWESILPVVSARKRPEVRHAPGASMCAYHIENFFQNPDQ